MKLSNIYFKEFTLRKFTKNVDEEFKITEGANDGLETLLASANDLIFKKFNINPGDRSAYFIAGSARLYVYQEIRDLFGLTNPLGDLDIVIPNKELWVNAGLEEAYNNGAIYRPTNDGTIEAFDVWDPSKAGGAYADVTVRSTQEIMGDTTLIHGYNFMSLLDVIDYKMSLNRDKEKEVSELIHKFNDSNPGARTDLLRSIVETIGLSKTKEFLGNMKK